MRLPMGAIMVRFRDRQHEGATKGNLFLFLDEGIWPQGRASARCSSYGWILRFGGGV